MLLKVGEFLKKFWGYIVTGVGIILGLFLFKKKSDDYQVNIDDLKNTHTKEINKINEARIAERKQYEENEKRYQKALAEIQKKYDDAKQDLDKKKKDDIKEIIEKYGTRPDVLAEKLSEVTGFKIVLPED